MNASRIILIIFLVALLAGNVFFATRYFVFQDEVNRLYDDLAVKNKSQKALHFASFFVKAVLKAEGEVDFETRLKLEGAVRDLDDPAILQKWKQFVDAGDDFIAQSAVKDLLDMLLDEAKL